MTDEVISPLRRRMIEDMTIRKLVPKTQQGYIRNVKAFVQQRRDGAAVLLRCGAVGDDVSDRRGPHARIPGQGSALDKLHKRRNLVPLITATPGSAAHTNEWGPPVRALLGAALPPPGDFLHGPAVAARDQAAARLRLHSARSQSNYF